MALESTLCGERKGWAPDRNRSSQGDLWSGGTLVSNVCIGWVEIDSEQTT